MRVYTGYQGPSRTQMAHGNQGDVERGQLVANGWVTRRGTTQRKREAGLVAAELSLAPRPREREGAAVSRTPLPAWGAASPRQPGGSAPGLCLRCPGRRASGSPAVAAGRRPAGLYRWSTRAGSSGHGQGEDGGRVGLSPAHVLFCTFYIF